MKLQGMAILYVIIIIPMLIVISLTLSGYRDQLNNNLKYNSELTGAVNDGITAFELNSASQEYSNVSDNFTSLVEASVNIFRRSIATRLNMTNADEALMNRYFPLALFTGYSGYYIYSPTYAPVVVKNPYTGQAAFSSDTIPSAPIDKDSGIYNPENMYDASLQYTPVLLKHKNHNNNSGGSNVLVTTKKDLSKNNALAKEEIDYSLKQMIPYTLELNQDRNNINSDNKILLNFTLDNYISFTGKVKGVAYNKSGYLLNNDTKINLKRGATTLYDVTRLNQDLIVNELTYFDEYVDEYIETELIKGNELINLTVTENDNAPVTIVFNPAQYRAGRTQYFATNREQMTGQYAYQRQQLDAIKYYIKAANFSNFVYKNLNNYLEEHIVDIQLPDSDLNYKKYFIEYDKNNRDYIFPTTKRVLDSNSTFNEVKRKAIRNSIQYDLIVATINYNYLVSSSEFILKLPVITDPDWERIVENVSFTAFLQGLSIGGGKKYSNYAVATSTINEFVINPNTVYYTDIQGFNQGHVASLESSELYYHKINCPDFLEFLTSKEIAGNDISTGAIGFKIGEWMYDAKWSREEAKYLYDHKNYSHFNCIINSNVKLNNLSLAEQRIMNKNAMSAVAAEKERSFKTNKIIDGGGYKIYTTSRISKGGNTINNIKGFEIGLKGTNNNVKEYNVRVNIRARTYSYVTTQTNNVLAFPSNRTSDSGKYSAYAEFVQRINAGIVKDNKWSEINNLFIEVRNLRTNEIEELAYVKVIYF